MSDRIYGGGTVQGLSEALAERVEEAVESLRLETDKKAFRAPQIIRGFAPAKRSHQEAEPPTIIVYPVDGRIENDGTYRVKAGISAVIYGEDFSDSDWLLVIIHRVIQSFQERPVLAKRYILEYPLAWDINFDQAYPFWQLEMITEWTIPAPVMLPDEGVI